MMHPLSDEAIDPNESDVDAITNLSLDALFARWGDDK
jgi:hypothetical protein